MELLLMLMKDYDDEVINGCLVFMVVSLLMIAKRSTKTKGHLSTDTGLASGKKVTNIFLSFYFKVFNIFRLRSLCVYLYHAIVDKTRVFNKTFSLITSSKSKKKIEHHGAQHLHHEKKKTLHHYYFSSRFSKIVPKRYRLALRKTLQSWRAVFNLLGINRKLTVALQKSRYYGNYILFSNLKNLGSLILFNKLQMKWGKWLWQNNILKLGWWRHLTGSAAEPNTKPRNLRLALYKKMPLRELSQWAGRLHTREDLPEWLHAAFINLYVWMFKCNVHEAVIDDLSKYKNLSQFFRRELKPGLRPIHDTCMTSPADGKVLHLGRVENGIVEQVKGVTYSLKGFLGPQTWLDKQCSQVDLKGNGDQQSSIDLNDNDFHKVLLQKPDNVLYNCIIYLGPGDYHRFHSPTDWNVHFQRHFPGELFSVNPGVARWLQGLFNFNERAVFYGEWEHGFFSMAAVGATNVGSVRVYFDEDLQTNSDLPYVMGEYYDKDRSSSPISLSKGENFGEFNIGSTIVLVFEAPPEFQFTIHPGQKLKVGEPLGN